jgi:nucleotide-binding universal stress UspA family protein
MERKIRANAPIRRGPFRHVLIPTDLTERTERALEMVETLALPEESRVTLVHVIETIDGVASRELKAFYARLERRAKVAMSSLVRPGGARTRRPSTAVVYGRRAEAVVQFAAAHDVDLIVLASHRVDPSLANRDWGTISYKVGILAQCPVLLVK